MPKSFDDLTVEELKDKLSERDLPVSGNKDELIARLRGEADEAKTPAKRATELSRFAELNDPDWVRGNPEQTSALQKMAADLGPVPKP